MNSGWRVTAGLAIALLIATVAILRLMGRNWWCECGGVELWISSSASAHTSQHWFDPYTLTHISHGFIFCWLLVLCPGIPISYRFVTAIVIECVWEIFENTPFVINRYRETTAALGYAGDSIANSVGDIFSCAIGFLIAWRIGWRYTLLLFIVSETVLLITIRDNLLLNILLLCWPIEAIKQWQLG